MPFTLVLGGARSGKTRWAQDAAMAAAQGAVVTMIATAEALDGEMAERIERHRRDRGAGWRTVEAPTALADAIVALNEGQVAVIDCLTLWLANILARDAAIDDAVGELLAVCKSSRATLFLVSNEVGLGIVPDNALARRFRDEAGRLHQALARAADRVVFIAAGLSMQLK